MQAVTKTQILKFLKDYCSRQNLSRIVSMITGYIKTHSDFFIITVFGLLAFKHWGILYIFMGLYINWYKQKKLKKIALNKSNKVPIQFYALEALFILLILMGTPYEFFVNIAHNVEFVKQWFGFIKPLTEMMANAIPAINYYTNIAIEKKDYEIIGWIQNCLAMFWFIGLSILPVLIKELIFFAKDTTKLGLEVSVKNCIFLLAVTFICIYLPFFIAFIGIESFAPVSNPVEFLPPILSWCIPLIFGVIFLYSILTIALIKKALGISNFN